MQISDLRDHSDAYFVVKGTITVAATNANNGTNKKLAFKNNELHLDHSNQKSITRTQCGRS